jgi:hypothetical protein
MIIRPFFLTAGYARESNSGLVLTALVYAGWSGRRAWTTRITAGRLPSDSQIGWARAGTERRTPLKRGVPARGIARAALTLQSAVLQALVAYGVMSQTQALEIVDVAMDASMRNAASKAGDDVEMVVIEALQGVRTGLVDLLN